MQDKNDSKLIRVFTEAAHCTARSIGLCAPPIGVTSKQQDDARNGAGAEEQNWNIRPPFC
jgi:hypothetical protein